MSRLPRLAIAALMLFGVGAAAAAQRVTSGAIPAWVVNLEPDTSLSSAGVDTSEGIHHLLLDVQVNGLVDPITTFSHRAWRVLGEEGVQNGSTIRITFDPSFEELVLHEVSVLRGDRLLPKLALERVRLIQREERLDAQIYDGALTALYFVEGVQAGDIVEYSYSLSGINPTFEGRWAEAFEVRWSVPLAEHHHRISFPASRPLQWLAHGIELEPVVSTEGSTQVLTWRHPGVEALHVEGGVPDWHDAWPWVQVSEWRSWSEVAAWGRRLFEPVEPIPAELKQLAKEWLAEADSPSERARRALRFVQDEVRYLGIEFGPNAYLPSQPGTVHERRFGDCKDKSVLLVELLRELGLDAEPALVATRTGRRLPERLPTPLVFDHAVVRLRLDGTEHWLDATRLHERGPIERLSVPEWGWALVLSPGVDQLVAVRARNSGRTQIHEVYDSADYETPVVFTVRTSFEGADADATRSMLAGSSREELQRSYRDYYAELWAGVEAVRPLDVQDDELANRIEVTEVYRIRDFWREAGAGDVREAELWCLALDEQLVVPSSVARKMPLLLSHPRQIEQRTSLRLHEAWSLDMRDVKVRDRAFLFDHHVRNEPDGVIELVHRYETLRSSVEPGRAGAFRRHVEQARETLGLTLTSKAGGAESSLRDLEWPLVFLVLFALLACCSTALLLSSRGKDQLREAQLPIGGLLLPLSLGVLASPAYGLFRIAGHSDALRRSTWRSLTSPAAPGWHSLAETERLLGLLGGALLVGLALLLASRWLARRREAPFLLLLFVAVGVAFDLADSLVLVLATPEDALLGLESLVRALAEGLGFGLLMTYLLRSERVRGTFVR